jgi:group I intron endonuclease
MVGIYKWTSPTNRVYVGQSKNLDGRRKWYLSGGVNKASMPKIKRSFEKYGIENHVWEIIEICPLEKLNEREIYWGLFYDALEDGLNCKLGEQNSLFSSQTKKLMSEAKKGISQSKEHKNKRLKVLKPLWEEKSKATLKREKEKPSRPPYKMKEETKKKISKSKTGVPIHTEESKQKFREIGKNRPWLDKMRKKSIESTSTPASQYDKQGNFIAQYPSAASAEESFNKKGSDNIRACIRGKQKTAYGYIWKEKL